MTMASIRETVIQFLQNIRGLGEPAAQPRAGEGPPARLALSPGTEVLATVMGKYENGMSLVKISSHLFAMDLPSRVQVGDSLRMTFLHQDARPTFALAGHTLSGTPLTLSPAGQLVKQLMSDSGPVSGNAVSSLPVPEPVLDGPPTDTARLAGRLRQALGESGLFYESHLKEWARGERPLAEILREPQGTLSRPDARASTPETTPTARPEGETPAEPPISGMPPDSESPDAAILSQREGKADGTINREPAAGGTPVRDGRARPDGRPDGAELAASPDSAEDDPGRAAGGALPEKQAAGPAVQESPGHRSNREKPDGMPTVREKDGDVAGEAAPARRDDSGVIPDDFRDRPVSERSPVSPPVREQAFPGREVAEKPTVAPESTQPDGTGRIPDDGSVVNRAAVSGTEQRTRLLKEIYGQLDPALLEEKAPDTPAEAPRAEVERNAGLLRPGPSALGTDAHHDADRTSPVQTPGLSPVEAREGKDALPASSPLQGEIADSRTLPLVRQQLNLLNSGIVLWQGEAWQGQPMEWEVEEREAHPDQGEERGWRTTLRLDLPNLGRVAAVINLEGKDLNLSLSVGSTDSAFLLGERTGALRERLAAAGIEVQGVVVRHEELEGA
jgi:hypothetical protein